MSKTLKGTWYTHVYGVINSIGIAPCNYLKRLLNTPLI